MKDLSLSMHQLGILEEIICNSSQQVSSELLKIKVQVPVDMIRNKNSQLMTILLKAKDLARQLNSVRDPMPPFQEPLSLRL